MYSKPTDYSPGIDFNTPAMKKHRSLRFFKDHLARWGVAAGGMGVILAILLIFFYLLYEVAPLFKSAEINEVARYNTPAEAPLYLAMEEQAEIAMRAYADGSLLFTSTASGARIDQINLPVPSGAAVLTVVQDAAGSSLMAAGLSNGQVILFQQDYRISWPDDQRVITPAISFPYGGEPLSLFSGTAAINQLGIADSEERLLIAASLNNQLQTTAFTKEEDFLTETITLEQQTVSLPLISSQIKKILISPDQRWLYISSGERQLELINTSDMDAPYLHSTINLTDSNAQVTEIQFLLGGVSLLVGDSSGTIKQWFLVREGETEHLQSIRSFQLGSSPIEKIIPEYRRKGFLATDSSGDIGLFYTTAHRTLLKQTLPINDVYQIAIAPRGNYLMVDGSDGVSFQTVENEHPEISWSALWNEVWYESYENLNTFGNHPLQTTTSKPS